MKRTPGQLFQGDRLLEALVLILCPCSGRTEVAQSKGPDPKRILFCSLGQPKCWTLLPDHEPPSLGTLVHAYWGAGDGAMKRAQTLDPEDFDSRDTIVSY